MQSADKYAVATNEESFGSQKTAIVKPETKTQVVLLGLIGRAVPVFALAASAAVAWYANSAFWFALTTLGAALFFLVLCLHFVLWRLQCQRPATEGELERNRNAGPSTRREDSRVQRVTRSVHREPDACG